MMKKETSERTFILPEYSKLNAERITMEYKVHNGRTGVEIRRKHLLNVFENSIGARDNLDFVVAVLVRVEQNVW
jgi:hypothetical protein